MKQLGCFVFNDNNEIYKYRVEKPGVIVGALEYNGREYRWLPLEDLTTTPTSLQRDIGTNYEVVIDKVVKTNTVEDIPLEDIQKQRISELKDKISDMSDKPRVDTGLGYFVDGGRDNKDDFFSVWETMADAEVQTVRDADNAFHQGVTKAQMQTIYRAIVANGKALLEYKWSKEVEINACTTVAQVLLVEI